MGIFRWKVEGHESPKMLENTLIFKYTASVVTDELQHKLVPLYQSSSLFLKNDMHEQLIRSIILNLLGKQISFWHFPNHIIDHLLRKRWTCYCGALKKTSGRMCFEVIAHYQSSHFVKIYQIVVAETIEKGGEVLSWAEYFPI